MDNSIVETTDINILRQAWQALEQEQPGIRIREAARLLNSSEAQLLATGMGENCIRLEGHWPELVQQWKSLGQVMSLTRNEACILEHKGIFEKVNTFGSGDHAMATVIGPIETRVFFKSWHVAFAVRQEKNGRQLQSIQVFDQAGEAITKIYLQPKSHQAAFEQLICHFRAADQRPEQEVISSIAAVQEAKAVDAEAFLSDWNDLQDTHDFFPMLRRHQVNRYQALELAAGRYTRQIDPEHTHTILNEAAASKLPVMIFAGNHGNLQIHQGRVRTIRMLERGHHQTERWLNVLDPAFNMHLRQDMVETAWVVQKPTRDGIVTSVELFDREQKLIAQFFGLRKPGTPQLKDWELLISHLS